MPPACVIVCEKTGRWAAALRVWLPPGAELWQTRSWPESRTRLSQAPASIVAVECSGERVVEVCRWLREAAAEFPRVRSVVLAEPGLQAAQCAWRTAGAEQVVYRLQELSGIARWIARHLQQVPQPPRSPRQWAWERMPWGSRRPDPFPDDRHVGQSLRDRGSTTE